MSNVIQFPKGKKGAPPQTLDEVVGRVQSFQKEYADVLAGTMLHALTSCLDDEGVTTESISLKDVAIVGEMIRSLAYKTVGLEHPFQKAVEKMFTDPVEDPSIPYMTRIEITEHFKKFLEESSSE